MTCRRWAVLAAALVLGSIGGCSLPREAIGAGPGIDGGPHDSGHGAVDTGVRIDTGITPVDTGVSIDAGRDTGIVCPTSCDDGLPCTDDSCDSTGACMHVPSTASCDDGVLCNGADTCSAGACTVHDGISPCAAPTHCDLVTDTCVGCAGDSDCPMPIDGPRSACDFGGDLCTTTGTDTRTVTTFTCAASGMCVGADTTASGTCTRASTDGSMCAAPAYGDWSACDFGTDPCTSMGVQLRTTTTSACSGGTCVPTEVDETQTCTRPSTDGMPCGTPVVTDWSACMVGATCATTGTQTRSSTTQTCTSGACVVDTSMQSQMCTVGSTAGATCGTTTCTDWSACMQTSPGSCDRTGSQTRSCSTPVCAAGGSATTDACTGVALTTERQACNFSVSGASCSTTSCGPCREPGILTGCRSHHTGSQRCSTTNGSCMDWGLGPFCGGLPTYSTVSCACP